jgi:hypothetical protein
MQNTFHINKNTKDLLLRQNELWAGSRQNRRARGFWNLHRFAAGVLRKSTPSEGEDEPGLVTRKYRVYGRSKGVGATLTLADVESIVTQEA